jgi:hypothetical protein
MTSFMGDARRAKGTTMDPRRRGTRLHRPGFDDDQDELSDNGPVTGWLVVIDGPGRGRAVELGFGLNTIGTSVENRVQLDFGDVAISREEHFSIAYDAIHKKFHLIRGRGANLVYVDNLPLTDARELQPYAEILLGATQLRFIPLCGPDWAWPETTADKPA